MAMRKIYSEIRGMKLKEVPGYVKPMLSVGVVKKSIQRGLDNYHAKYIETDSIEPLYHICFGGMIFSYLVALPNERRHLEHKQHAEQHGHHYLKMGRVGLFSGYGVTIWLFERLPWKHNLIFCYGKFSFF
ncbi:ATP synthase subunit f, mitochondrial [Gossypium australe]|uniref:ATP synthase subunit f, mitochondrial n=1 Tax=Gossypium australe TaxID=47621 RepID=A0A5B6WWU1_9ROSI|nr:ATP synthase subunit f, mitochondrial [Gossypium australe]